jgi:hypothetical protein
MSDKPGNKRGRDELSEDEQSVASDQAISNKYEKQEPFVSIPSTVSKPSISGEISPLDGIATFDHSRLSPQALDEHNRRTPFSMQYRGQNTSSSTLTASSSNPTPVKTKKRVKFLDIDDQDNTFEPDIDQLSNVFNTTHFDRDRREDTDRDSSPETFGGRVYTSSKKNRGKKMTKRKTRTITGKGKKTR